MCLLVKLCVWLHEQFHSGCPHSRPHGRGSGPSSPSAGHAWWLGPPFLGFLLSIPSFPACLTGLGFQAGWLLPGGGIRAGGTLVLRQDRSGGFPGPLLDHVHPPFRRQMTPGKTHVASSCRVVLAYLAHFLWTRPFLGDCTPVSFNSNRLLYLCAELILRRRAFLHP